jgi:hypothetical protein
VTPVDDITVEVRRRSGTSTVFQAAEAIGAFTYADADVNGKPIGLALLKNRCSATSVVVILRHEP